jgi:nucleoside-diphosphate-sugar epimerase
VSRVLLTGASGFLGRPTVDALAHAGHEVHAVARTPGMETPGVAWHAVDLLAGCDVVYEVEPEIVLHLAWYAEHGRYWSSPENVRWVEASLALMRALLETGCKRMVIAGTCAEYEWSREVYPESAPCRPTTLYGAAKHSLHELAEALAEQADMSLAWGRLFFLYGPFEARERFVASVAGSLLRGERAAMTEGLQHRDFMHVADAAAAFAALADSSLTGAINVASGLGVTMRELAAAIALYAGSPELLDVGALPSREGEPHSIVADVTRLREELGWTPRLSLEEGIEDTVEWWRSRL